MRTLVRNQLEETLAGIELRIWNTRTRCRTDRDTGPCRQELRALLGVKQELLEQLSNLAESDANGIDRRRHELLRLRAHTLLQRAGTRWPPAS